MIDEVILTSSYISCFLGILCFCIVLVYNKTNFYSNALILSCILSCTIIIFFWTFFKGIVPIVPRAEIYVASFPLYFLAGSLLFIYIRSVVTKSGRKFRWKDLIHLSPFILSVIHAIYFFSFPTSAQRESFSFYMQHVCDYQQGNLLIFPMAFHMTIAFSLWGFYLLRIVLLLNYVQKKNPSWVQRNLDLWKWLSTLTAISFIGLLFFVLNALFVSNLIFIKVINLPIIFFLVVSIVFVMFYPKVLYRLKFKLIDPNNEGLIKKEKIKSLELSPEKVALYTATIDRFMCNEEVFLKKNYSLSEMSRDIGIPLHHLSHMINNLFGTNYTNFINKFRINYIIEHRYDQKWKQYSLEGISYEAGFASRATFFKAFRNVTGKTPAEFFKLHKEDPQQLLK